MDHQVLRLISSFLLLLRAICTTTHTSGTSFGVSHNRTGEYSYAGYAKYSHGEFLGVYCELGLDHSTNITGEDVSTAQVAIGRVHNNERYFYLTAGWMVNPKDFDDTHSMLFASYKFGQGDTCYTFQPGCTDFIMLKNLSYFAMPPTHTSANALYAQDIQIVQDNKTNDWVLTIGELKVGYWNTSSKSELHGGADMVAWYGEVFKSIRSPSPVPMGSGVFPEEEPYLSSYIINLQYVNNKENISKMGDDELTPYQNKPSLYKVGNLSIDERGTSFHYGGPGKHAS